MSLLLYHPNSLTSTYNSTLSRDKAISLILNGFHTIYHHNGIERKLCGSMEYSYVSLMLRSLHYYFFIVIDDKDVIKGFSLFTSETDYMYIELLCSFGYGSLLLTEIHTITKQIYDIPIVRLVSLPSSVNFYLKYGYTFSRGSYYVENINTNETTIKSLTPIEILDYISNVNFKLYSYDDTFLSLKQEEYLMEIKL